MDIVISALLPLAVVFIMFSLGLDLTPADFTRIARRPRAFCIGALAQIVLLPLVAYVVILIFGFSGEIAVGLMILAACPGGAASNWQVVRANIADLGPGLLTLVAALSVIAYALSRALRASRQEAKTIAVETGVQNGALALAIAGLVVAGGPVFNAYAVPAALYGVVWLGSAMPAFLLLARQSNA